MDDKVGIKEDESEEQLESEEEEEDYEELVKMTSPVAANWDDNGLVKGVVIIDDDALLLYDSKSLFNSKFKVKVVDKNHKVMLKNNTSKRKRKRMDNHTCFQVFDVCPICYDPWTSSYQNHQLW
ncbi:hypothetical protein Tco_1026885 [Tanacetum coccineum]